MASAVTAWNRRAAPQPPSPAEAGEVVEAAAERIWRAMAGRAGERRRIPWDEEGEDERERCRYLARAALAPQPDAEEAT